MLQKGGIYMNQKRLRGGISIIILLVVMLSIVSAVAEDFDLTRMSNEEIVVLMNQVSNEIVNRGIEKTATLAKGTYIAGVDIPAGKYVYTCLAKGEDWGNITIYSDQGAGKQLLWNVVTAPEEGEKPETIFITLNTGDQLKSGVPFSLTIMAGITFR